MSRMQWLWRVWKHGAISAVNSGLLGRGSGLARSPSPVVYEMGDKRQTAERHRELALEELDKAIAHLREAADLLAQSDRPSMEHEAHGLIPAVLTFRSEVRR